MMDEVALEQFFSEFVGVFLLIIPPLLLTHLSSSPHEVCDISDEAAHLTLGPKFGASSLTRHLDGLKSKDIFFSGGETR
jgi:hypothetical protein